MKKSFFILAFSILALASVAQNDTLAMAQQLIQKKKYESAMNLLQCADSNNNRPDYVIAKTELVLNYFVTSIMHQFFALKDLKPNEDVDDYRGLSGNYSLIYFAPDSLLKRLKTIYPDNYLLYKTLGDFYRSVDNNYGNWLSDSVLDYMYENYDIAYHHGVFDEKSLFCLGYYHLLNQAYEKSIPFFLKSLELNPQNADCHYNVAYAYIYAEKPDLAVPHVKKSFTLYKDNNLKSDAARMLGVIYFQRKDYVSALKYFRKADKILPDDFTTLMYILDAQLELNDKKSVATTIKIFNLEPGHPTICKSLTDSYIAAGKVQDLIIFFQNKINKSSFDDRSIGYIYYFLGGLYKENKDNAKTKESYLKAKEFLLKAGYNDDEVYQTIEEYLKELE